MAFFFFLNVNYFNDASNKNEQNDCGNVGVQSNCSISREFLEAVKRVKRLSNEHSELQSFSPCSLFPQPVLPLFQQLNLQGEQDK